VLRKYFKLLKVRSRDRDQAHLTWPVVPFPVLNYDVLAHLYWIQPRKFPAFDIMRIWSLLTSIALLTSTALTVEVVCTFVLNVFTLPVFVDQGLS
jgi:hypothetical protein